MAPRVRTQMLTSLIERGTRAATIAKDALDNVGKVCAAKDGEDVLRDICPQRRHEHGNPVENGIFTLATDLRALEDAFEDIGAFFAKDTTDYERGFDAGLTTHGADGCDRLEMSALQRLAPDHDGWAAWRHDFTNGGRDGCDAGGVHGHVVDSGRGFAPDEDGKRAE